MVVPSSAIKPFNFQYRRQSFTVNDRYQRLEQKNICFYCKLNLLLEKDKKGQYQRTMPKIYNGAFSETS